jgi:response regulator RpfG family c-di-GMP phosphodiesterase
VAEARAALQGCEGHFDPDVVEAFADVPDARIEEIRRQGADGPY